jgi:uncharacterized protein YbaP (TraB family)
MQLKRLVSSASALLLGLAGCTGHVVERPPAGAVPGPALWQVSDEDTTIYLFGTVHALPQDTQWFDGRVERAFTASDELVTEIDLSDAAASGQALAAAGMLPAGQNLRELMSAEDRIQYEEALVTLGLQVEALDRMEPWLAAMTLSLLPLLRDGYQSENGVEMALGTRAEGKKRGGLEKIEDQVAIFDTLPVEAQLAFLDQTVEQVPQASTTLGAMVAEWLVGDADQLAALLNAELTDPALYDRLLTQRNAHWADWLQKRLEAPGTVFVAVGAGHLAGRGSVQEQLRKRGVEVRRIWK